MKKKVLLIEDDVTIVEIYKTAIESKGFLVDVVYYAGEARDKIEKIEKGEEKKPDLVLLDIILPDASGLDILEEMRKKEKTKDIPVFILTNYSDDELKKASLKLKVEKFIIKAENLPNEVAEEVKKKLG
jgi:DNA-binding response OmpR family regulator